MYGPSALLLATLATCAFAAPRAVKERGLLGLGCLTQSQAQNVINGFLSITSGAGTYQDSVCQGLLASDFSDTSSSIASIVDNGGTTPIPLGGPTFSSKAAFCTANADQPATTFTQLNMYYTCTDVIFRFAVSSLSPQVPLGITIIETTRNSQLSSQYPYQISQVYGELDSAAWIVDEGMTCGNASST